MKYLQATGEVVIAQTPAFFVPVSYFEPWKASGNFDFLDVYPLLPHEQYVWFLWTLKSGVQRSYMYHAQASLRQNPVNRQDGVEVSRVSEDINQPDWPHTGLRGGNYYNRSYRGRELLISDFI